MLSETDISDFPLKIAGFMVGLEVEAGGIIRRGSNKLVLRPLLALKSLNIPVLVGGSYIVLAITECVVELSHDPY